MSAMSRRRLLSTAGALAAASSVAPQLVALQGCNVVPDSLGSDGDGHLQVDLGDHPELNQVDGFSLLSVADTGQLLAVVRVAEAGDRPFVVLAGICTHADCRVDTYDRSQQRLICRCHDSEFELDGTVWGGPALLPLDEYDYTLDGDILDIGLIPVD
jgi:cytochrome b6-f complex iron-sulfur subunit